MIDVEPTATATGSSMPATSAILRQIYEWSWVYLVVFIRLYKFEREIRSSWLHKSGKALSTVSPQFGELQAKYNSAI